MSTKPLLFDPLLPLLRRAQNGDKRAAEGLVRALSPKIFAVSYRILQNPSECEEITQEVLIKVWNISNEWRSGEALLETWAYRVTTNLCFDRLRKSSKMRIEDADFDDWADNHVTAEFELINKEIKNEIDKALAILPPRQRAAISLTYFEQLSAAKVGEILDCSVEAIESLLARAKKNLKTLLEQEGNEFIIQLAAS